MVFKRFAREEWNFMKILQFGSILLEIFSNLRTRATTRLEFSDVFSYFHEVYKLYRLRGYFTKKFTGRLLVPLYGFNLYISSNL